MSYIVLNPRRTGIDDARDKLARIAHSAWHIYNGRSLAWRTRYYSELFNDGAAFNRSAAVIQYCDERKNEISICAFICILRLKPLEASHHMKNLDLQYGFSATDLDSGPSRRHTYHYFQSLFVDESHRNSAELIRILYKESLLRLKRQGCGRNGCPFVVYAQADLRDGKRVAERRGFERRTESLYVLTNEMKSSRMMNDINAMWTH